MVITEEMGMSTLTANSTLIIIKVDGVINFDTSDDLYEFTQQQIQKEGARILIFEVSEVAYVSSAGLGVFMSLYEASEEHHGKIILVGVSDAFHRVLELVGALDYFSIVQTLAEARDIVTGEFQ